MTSRMHLKSGRSTGNGAYAQNGTSSRVMVASSPKVSFDHIESPVPEIMDGFMYVLLYSVISKVTSI
jgi:hypothetical protein